MHFSNPLKYFYTCTQRAQFLLLRAGRMKLPHRKRLLKHSHIFTLLRRYGYQVNMFYEYHFSDCRHNISQDISATVTASAASTSLLGQNVTSTQAAAPALRNSHVSAVSGAPYSLSMLSSISGGVSATDNILSLPVSNLNTSASGLQILSTSGGGAATPGAADKSSNLFRNIMPNSAGYLPSPTSEHSHSGGASNNGGAMHAGGNVGAHSMTQYSSLLGNNPSSILNNGLNPLAPAVSSMSSPNSISLSGVMGNGTPLSQTNVMQHQGQAQHQPAFYVQQAVYLDQNGQPLYYRAGSSSLKKNLFLLPI